MVYEQTFTKCKHFKKTECEYSNDEILMKKLINRMKNDQDVRDLDDQVIELRCNYCEAFENK